MAARIDVYFPARFNTYDETFLLCRRLRHAWTALGFYRFRNNGTSYLVEVLQCTRCETEREDFFDDAGGYVGSNRIYPEGYLIAYTDEEREREFRFNPRTAAKVRLKRALTDRSVATSRDAIAQRRRAR